MYRQLHCHFFSPNHKSVRQARNVVSKKYIPPFLKTPKQVIRLIEKNGEYEGTDDIVCNYSLLKIYPSNSALGSSTRTNYS